MPVAPMRPFKGDCYVANGRKVMNFGIAAKGDPKKSPYRLCHGIAILQTDGKPFGHCWIEKGSTVLDYSNGRNIKLNKTLYHTLGQIDEKSVYRYNPEEVMLKMVRAQHWGPWDSNPPR